jgi:hypothetical protein
MGECVGEVRDQESGIEWADAKTAPRRRKPLAADAEGVCTMRTSKRDLDYDDDDEDDPGT